MPSRSIVLHREDVHLRRAHELLLDLVEIADADEHRVSASTAGSSPPMRASSARLGAEQRRQRHAVHVAGLARLGRVHVAVRIDPDEPELLAALAQKRRRRRDRSRAEAVIAAEHDRNRAFFERAERALKQLLADARDVLDVALVLVARTLGFGNRGGDVALVDDRAPEAGEMLADAGDAKRRRPHVGAATIAAEVERNADDVDDGLIHLLIW